MASLLIAAAAVAVTVSGTADDASAAGVDVIEHPSVVPDVPNRGYPITLHTPGWVRPDGRIRYRETKAAHLLEGRYLLSGGNFLEVELPDGTVIDHPYLAVVDTTTNELLCRDLAVDDEVLAFHPGPRPGTVFIGGRFDKVTGSDGVQRTRNSLALIDLTGCSVDRTWVVPGIDGRVTEIDVHGDRVFFSGSFLTVDGASQPHLAEVSLTTRQLNPATRVALAGHSLNPPILALATSPDGSRLGIIHRALTVDGADQRLSAIFDITDPTTMVLTPHRARTDNGAWVEARRLRGGAFSPDFSMLSLAFAAGWQEDYVYAIPTMELPDQLGWRNYVADSAWATAISNEAVYLIGHFCKVTAGPSPTEIMAPNSGPDRCSGTNLIPDGAHRTQIAAFDIVDGTPLPWNPGNSGAVGGRFLEVTERGLLVGFDGDRFNNVRTGTTAFLDFGVPADPRDDQSCTASEADGTVTVVWDAVEGVNDYVVRRNTRWVASPGDVSSYVDTPPPGTHRYRVRTTLDGVQRDVDCSPDVTVADLAQTCAATRNADDTVSLSWSAIAGEDTYTVRRNGSWLTTLGQTTHDDDPGDGVHTYVVRSQINGIQTNTTCSPTITVEPPPPPTQTCTRTTNADGTITLSWTAIDGETSYVVRRNGTFLVDNGAALSWTSDDPEPDAMWAIRSRMGGVITETDC